jgi:hypothetical protein
MRRGPSQAKSCYCAAASHVGMRSNSLVAQVNRDQLLAIARMSQPTNNFKLFVRGADILCGPVVTLSRYSSRKPVFDSRRYHIF